MDRLDLLVPVGTRVADMFFDWKHFKLNKKSKLNPVWLLR